MYSLPACSFQQLQQRGGSSVWFWGSGIKLGSQEWLVVLAYDCLRVGLPGLSLSPS